MEVTEIKRCGEITVGMDDVTFHSNIGKVSLSLDIVDEIQTVLLYEDKMRKFTMRIRKLNEN